MPSWKGFGRLLKKGAKVAASVAVDLPEEKQAPQTVSCQPVIIVQPAQPQKSEGLMGVLLAAVKAWIGRKRE